MDLFNNSVREDPFSAGINAFQRGEGWDRCPRYDDSYSRFRWQQGWSAAFRSKYWSAENTMETSYGRN